MIFPKLARKSWKLMLKHYRRRSYPSQWIFLLKKTNSDSSERQRQSRFLAVRSFQFFLAILASYGCICKHLLDTSLKIEENLNKNRNICIEKFKSSSFIVFTIFLSLIKNLSDRTNVGLTPIRQKTLCNLGRNVDFLQTTECAEGLWTLSSDWVSLVSEEFD